MKYPDFVKKKYKDRDSLVKLLLKIRNLNKKIVLTNGCFDILHTGHVAYLSKARRFGDVLIVGLNTDESIKKYKDPKRPINKFEDRLTVLSGLSSVNYITPLPEDRPAKLIKAVKPDIYVKGGDYDKNKIRSTPIVEKLGGKVVIIPFIRDYSTTALIDIIRQKFCK